MKEGRGAYRVLVGEPERKRTPGRHRGRWEDNIKMRLQKTGRGEGSGDWINLVEDRHE
jgi:hypothetical protein